MSGKLDRALAARPVDWREVIRISKRLKGFRTIQEYLDKIVPDPESPLEALEALLGVCSRLRPGGCYDECVSLPRVVSLLWSRVLTGHAVRIHREIDEDFEHHEPVPAPRPLLGEWRALLEGTTETVPFLPEVVGALRKTAVMVRAWPRDMASGDGPDECYHDEDNNNNPKSDDARRPKLPTPRPKLPLVHFFVFNNLPPILVWIAAKVYPLEVSQRDCLGNLPIHYANLSAFGWDQWRLNHHAGGCRAPCANPIVDWTVSTTNNTIGTSLGNPRAGGGGGGGGGGDGNHDNVPGGGARDGDGDRNDENNHENENEDDADNNNGNNHQNDDEDHTEAPPPTEPFELPTELGLDRGTAVVLLLHLFPDAIRSACAAGRTPLVAYLWSLLDLVQNDRHTSPLSRVRWFYPETGGMLGGVEPDAFGDVVRFLESSPANLASTRDPQFHTYPFLQPSLVGLLLRSPPGEEEEAHPNHQIDDEQNHNNDDHEVENEEAFLFHRNLAAAYLEPRTGDDDRRSEDGAHETLLLSLTYLLLRRDPSVLRLALVRRPAGTDDDDRAEEALLNFYERVLRRRLIDSRTAIRNLKNSNGELKAKLAVLKDSNERLRRRRRRSRPPNRNDDGSHERRTKQPRIHHHTEQKG